MYFLTYFTTVSLGQYGMRQMILKNVLPVLTGNNSREVMHCVLGRNPPVWNTLDLSHPGISCNFLNFNWLENEEVTQGIIHAGNVHWQTSGKPTEDMAVQHSVYVEARLSTPVLMSPNRQ